MFVTVMQLNCEGDAAMAKAFGNTERKKDTKNCNRTRNVHSVGSTDIILKLLVYFVCMTQFVQFISKLLQQLTLCQILSKTT